MKGMRVQSIIRELRGEKIDIIEYSEEPVSFATHALSPAKISRVNLIDVENKHMEVIVDDTQLSLAIGKRGQNVRLAAKLLGWKIDIKSEEEKRQEAENALNAITISGAPISVLLDHGLTDALVESLMASGVPTVERLGSMTPEELLSVEGIDQDGLVVDHRDAILDIGHFAQFNCVRHRRAELELHTQKVHRRQRLLLDVFANDRLLLRLDDDDIFRHGHAHAAHQDDRGRRTLKIKFHNHLLQVEFKFRPAWKLHRRHEVPFQIQNSNIT
jgi:hypothetical protein